MNKFIFLLVFFLVFGISFAQQDSIQDGTLDTEKLIIVKPYSPTVSDAFKVKQTPVVNDSTERKKKKVSYNIFSFPVASTFTPEKGRAAGVQRSNSLPSLYDNYLALGFGNYGNVMAQFYGNVAMNNGQNLGISLGHTSSQGGIKDVELDDKFYNTALELDYSATANTFTWGLNVGGKHQVYNWYGIPSYFNSINEYLAIDPQQTYYTVNVGGNIAMNDAVFNKAAIQYRRFGDAYSSGENRVIITPDFKFPAGEQLVDVAFTADYVSGNFDQSYLDTEKKKYSFFNIGIHPSLKLTQGDLAVDAGVEAVFSIDGQNDKNKFYIYPKVEGSYRLADEYFIVYAGAQGELKQNSYYDFVQENPYVSPTLTIAPTDKQASLYAGGKGKITETISYDARASYTSEKNKALFIHNVALSSETNIEGYENINSFSVAYDDVKTFTLFGELKAAVNEKFTMALNAAYHNYSTDVFEEAWNLPDFEASLNANYAITQKWFTSVSVFYVGERKDKGINQSIGTNPSDLIIAPYTKQPDSYIDANLKVGYQLNDRLSFFVKGNNLFGDNYYRWAGYPVQGIQVMGGATYQFDW